ncbi:MAG: chondroitinase-B domain-containing protein [Granulosicoccus sp.]
MSQDIPFIPRIISAQSSEAPALNAVAGRQESNVQANAGVLRLERSAGTPRLVSPIPGQSMSGASETFSWSAEGLEVDHWFLRVGLSPSSSEIIQTRIQNPSVTQYEVTGLPVDGRSDVFVELSFNKDGEWVRLISRHKAFDGGNVQAAPAPPAPSSPSVSDSAPPQAPAGGSVSSYPDTQYGPTIPGGRCPGIPDSFRNTTYVNSPNGLRDAVASAQPGDAVIVRNGTYNWNSAVAKSDRYERGADRPLVLNGYGTQSAPVYVLAESMHGVHFARSGVDWVLAGNHMVVAGFRFTTHGPLYVVNSDNRIACNTFTQTNSRYITVDFNDADRTEIDNNDFNGSKGNAIIMWQCNPMSSGCTKNSKGAHVHHNVFRNKPFADGKNGHEAIVLGLGYSPLEGVRTHNVDGENLDAVIENNLFDRWNGETELITIKSSRNIIRNNCVINASASNFVVRFGNDNLITGNWMEGASGGIRMSGRRNLIVFNYKSRDSMDMFGFRFHTGESYPASFRPNQNFDRLYTYIDASENVLVNNVLSGIKWLVETPRRINYVFQRKPTGNRIAGNDIYTDDFAGTNEAGGYYDSGDVYSESEFRRNNSWGYNQIRGYDLPPSQCGNANLFQGPGGNSATYQGTSNLLGGRQTIRAPSWW